MRPISKRPRNRVSLLLRLALIVLPALVVPGIVLAQQLGPGGNYGLVAGFSGGAVANPVIAPASASTTAAPGLAVGNATSGLGFSAPYVYMINTGTRIFYSDTTTMVTDLNFRATGTITSVASADIGWTVQAAANQACNTTCVNACVVGFDAGTSNTPVACTDATADKCLCAGSS